MLFSIVFFDEPDLSGMAISKDCVFSVAWAMPNRWTFQIPPIADFVRRWKARVSPVVIVDPFCGSAAGLSTHANDLARGGTDAEMFCLELARQGVKADMVLFDPPYSPRQIAECYKETGLPVTTETTQNAALYKRSRAALGALLRPRGVALSFGWQSAGFGKDYDTAEILLCQHGAAHNDTVCVAQFKRPSTPELFG